jgi:Flp pilus assembly protein TadD
VLWLPGQMTRAWIFPRSFALLGSAFLGCFAGPAALAQQEDGLDTGQAIVQAVPNNNSMNLNAALVRLGRNPKDFDALVDAGNAALAIGDVEASVGFFTRADQISPGNPRVRGGLASAYVQIGNPYDAIPLFDSLEQSVAADARMLVDRGLAYDLVADNVTAQRFYRQVLASGPNDEASRRLAVSLAITGDKRGSASALSSMLMRRDMAAWRARAFALAILDQTDEAVAVVNSTLPASLSGSIGPYLRYMPRLTPAQQAAAANLGQFPRASEIGRDDPRVASFATNVQRRPSLSSADSGLIPRGEPLGRKGRGRDNRGATLEADRRSASNGILADATPARVRQDARAAPPDPQPGRVEVPAPAVARNTVVNNGNSVIAPAQVVPAVGSPAAKPMASSRQTTQPVPASVLPPPVSSPATVAVAAPPPPVSTPLANPAPATIPASLPPKPIDTVPNGVAISSAPVVSVPSAPAPVPLPSPASATVEPIPAVVRPSAMPAATLPPQPLPPVRPPASSQPVPTSLAEAFSDLAKPVADAAPARGAVDIRRIRPAREGPAVAATPAKPAPPLHPSRIWVQLATGRDKSALGFDWRRMVKQADALFKVRRPSVSSWGQTNRLLTGPFESEAQANAFIGQLRRADIDGAFVWNSPAGQIVDPLGGK